MLVYCWVVRVSGGIVGFIVHQGGFGPGVGLFLQFDDPQLGRLGMEEHPLLSWEYQQYEDGFLRLHHIIRSGGSTRPGFC